MYSEKFNEKVKLFTDAARFENTTVPLLSNDYTWKVCDSGADFKDAYFKTKVMEKIVCAFHERYGFDAYIDLGTRNHFPQMQALGGGSYVLDEKTGGINVTDEPTLFPEDYEDFAKDPNKYLYIMFQRKFPNITTKDFVNATTAFLQAQGYAQNIAKTFTEMYETPMMVTTSASVQPPIEAFHSSFRGISGISVDMRRHKQALKAALDAYWEKMVLPSLARALSAQDKNYIADVYFAIISHEVLNRKQFDEFYVPYMQQILTKTAEAGRLVFIYIEDAIARFADYFSDVPKGSAIMHLEMDDIFEMRKLLPGMPLAGGMTTDLLGRGTPQECVERAKVLCNELGSGFIMSQNKMLSFRNDCRRENLLAVNDFVRGFEL